MSNIRIYFLFLASSVMSQMQYQASLLMLSLGQFMVTGIEFLVLLALFHRFDSLLSWSLAEVALFYGFIHVVFALADSLSRGFDLMPLLIKSGELDRMLLRPVPLILQVSSKEFTLRRVGRFFQGLIVGIGAWISLDIPYSVVNIILITWAGLSAFLLFQAIVILQATLCFWTTESIELGNLFTYGGVEAVQFPLSIYPLSIQRFFLFIVPLGAVSYFPLVYLIGNQYTYGMPGWFAWITPLAGWIFWLFSLGIFSIGLRHYTSSGS
jgi:ABC-2 type transport system permease protein